MDGYMEKYEQVAMDVSRLEKLMREKIISYRRRGGRGKIGVGVDWDGMDTYEIFLILAHGVKEEKNLLHVLVSGEDAGKRARTITQRIARHLDTETLRCPWNWDGLPVHGYPVERGYILSGTNSGEAI